MTSESGLDHLMRAAEAAGYALAAPEDEQAVLDMEAAVPSPVSVEERARGGTRGNKDVMSAISALAPNSVRSGTNSVRETVYGYLGFGVPA